MLIELSSFINFAGKIVNKFKESIRQQYPA